MMTRSRLHELINLCHDTGIDLVKIDASLGDGGTCVVRAICVLFGIKNQSAISRIKQNVMTGHEGTFIRDCYIDPLDQREELGLGAVKTKRSLRKALKKSGQKLDLYVRVEGHAYAVKNGVVVDKIASDLQRIKGIFTKETLERMIFDQFGCQEVNPSEQKSLKELIEGV